MDGAWFAEIFARLEALDVREREKRFVGASPGRRARTRGWTDRMTTKERGDGMGRKKERSSRRRKKGRRARKRRSALRHEHLLAARERLAGRLLEDDLPRRPS